MASTYTHQVHLVCEFTPDASPDVNLAVDVDYHLSNGKNAGVINDQIHAKVAEVLDGYLNNGVMWPSLSRQWGASVEISGDTPYTTRDSVSVEFAVDAYAPVAANPVQTFYYLRFDLDTGLLGCQDMYGYSHGSYASEPGTYRYMEFDLAAATVGCPGVHFEPDKSDFNIGEWVVAGVELDIENAAFDVRCPGLIGSPLYPRFTTFVEGIGDNPFGTEGSYIRVRQLAVVDVVEEWPGSEVIARIDCWGGGSGRSTELQVFAGSSSEPNRLGQILENRLLESTSAAYWGLGRYFVAKRYEYQPGDTNNQQSRYTSSIYFWEDEAWVESDPEVWTRQPDS